MLSPAHLGIGKRSQRAHGTSSIGVARISDLQCIRFNVQSVGRRRHCIPSDVDASSDTEAIVEALRSRGVSVPHTHVFQLGFLPLRPKASLDAGLFDGLNRYQGVPSDVPAGDGRAVAQRSQRPSLRTVIPRRPFWRISARFKRNIITGNVAACAPLQVHVPHTAVGLVAQFLKDVRLVVARTQLHVGVFIGAHNINPIFAHHVHRIQPPCGMAVPAPFSHPQVPIPRVRDGGQRRPIPP